MRLGGATVSGLLAIATLYGCGFVATFDRGKINSGVDASLDGPDDALDESDTALPTEASDDAAPDGGSEASEDAPDG